MKVCLCESWDYDWGGMSRQGVKVYRSLAAALKAEKLPRGWEEVRYDDGRVIYRHTTSPDGFGKQITFTEHEVK